MRLVPVLRNPILLALFVFAVAHYGEAVVALVGIRAWRVEYTCTRCESNENNRAVCLYDVSARSVATIDSYYST